MRPAKLINQTVLYISIITAMLGEGVFDHEVIWLMQGFQRFNNNLLFNIIMFNVNVAEQLNLKSASQNVLYQCNPSQQHIYKTVNIYIHIGAIIDFEYS